MAEENKKNYTSPTGMIGNPGYVDRRTRAQREADTATRAYERRYNPDAAAVDAYRRAMATQLRDSYNQERETRQSYSDLYQQARRQAARQGAMSNVSGFGGGRAQGAAAAMSAAEISALSRIASEGESALRGIRDSRASIQSNALLEAQQADQYQRAIQQQELARVEKIFEIIGSKTSWKSLSTSAKAKLRALGVTERNFEQVTLRSKETNAKQDYYNEPYRNRYQSTNPNYNPYLVDPDYNPDDI